jgi:2-polyprenyl-6-methoxyphenol hydroxylase-like FAD-dependent oxidoreductase
VTRTAAVVGGGIGGLAAAIGLRAAGWEVSVFERAEGMPETGTGLGMWPSALRALDRLDLGDQARKRGRPQASGTIRHPDGQLIARIDMARLIRREGEPVYLLSRPALLTLLADALPPAVIRFDSPVTDDLSAHYDLVVGADGINSGVRARMFPTSGLRYTGQAVWRGVSDLDWRVGGEIWGVGKKFGFTPEREGRTNWYAVLSAAEGWSPPNPQEVLRDRFQGWPGPIAALLDRFDDSDVVHHDLYHLAPPLSSYVDGNVALLGDAAHAMTPELGQGACQALIDGVALADCLSTGTVQAGLKAYDRLRRRPTQRIAKLSLRANVLSQTGRLPGVRDLAVRLATRLSLPS